MIQLSASRMNRTLNWLVPTYGVMSMDTSVHVVCEPLYDATCVHDEPLFVLTWTRQRS